MKASGAEDKLIHAYLQLLSGLSSAAKLELIAGLSLSIKTGDTPRKKALRKAFGALDGSIDAEGLINEIRSSRHFNREIEPF